MRAFGGRGCENHPQADVCSMFSHCQAWISDQQMKKNWKENYQANYEKIKRPLRRPGVISLHTGMIPLRFFIIPPVMAGPQMQARFFPHPFRITVW